LNQLHNFVDNISDSAGGIRLSTNIIWEAVEVLETGDHRFSECTYETGSVAIAGVISAVPVSVETVVARYRR
tara:strand:+ start:1229 stop:1444 length:216 start_codon:yes stop_codon:yes gene_type:complete